MINKIKYFLPNLCVFILLFLSFISILFFSSQNCISYDDFLCCFWNLNDTIWDCLFPNVDDNAGGYFVLLLTKLTTFGLPYYLNIHPDDFISKYNPIIKGLFFVCFLYFSSKIFIFRNSKNKWLFFSFLSFLLFFVLFQFLITDKFCIVDNITFYRYLFPTFFYSVAFFLLYKNVVFPRLKSTFCEKTLFVFSILVVATNLETVVFPFLLFIIFLFLYNFVIDLFSLFNNFGLFLKNYKFKFNFTFYFISFLLFILSFLYVSSPMFSHNFEWRGFGTFELSLKEICNFLTLLFDFYFVENSIFWILFFLVIFLLFYKKKYRVTIKKIFFSFLMVSAILIVYSSLFFFGKNGYDDNYWISDVKILIFFKIMFFSPLFILLDDFLRHLNIKHKKICVIILSCFFILVAVFYFSLILKYKNYIFHFAPFKKINYINEKMYRYFKLNNQIPYLIKINPNRSGQTWLPFPFLEILSDDANLFHKNIVCNSGVTKTSIYLEKLYKDEKSTSVKFCFTDDALDKFFELGGSITKDEILNLNFYNLQDDNYVLNSKISKTNRLSKEEIISIYQTYH